MDDRNTSWKGNGRMYRIDQFKIPCDVDMSDKLNTIEKHLSDRLKAQVGGLRIIKESIDARDKENVCWVYSLEFECSRIGKGKAWKNVRESLEKKSRREIFHGTEPMKHRPVVVGFGPCGMFAALTLAEEGYRPVVLERGKAVEDRDIDVRKLWDEGILDPESNVQFGEGGAGTFSDGKLTTGIKDRRIETVLKEFVEAGASPEILYQAKPHIGTDVLKVIVRNIREKIISLGGEIRFSSRLEDLEFDTDGLKRIKVDGEWIEADNIILAPGHSARDTFRMLKEKEIPMERKPFSIGVRVEHDQKMIDESQYGRFAEFLPPADYKLVHHVKDDRGVYTFCMCPGGEIVKAASHEGCVVTNGMSNSRRDSGRANSALLVDVKVSDFESDDILAGVVFQEKYERLAFESSHGRYEPVETTWGEFKSGGTDVEKCLPEFVKDAYIEAMPHLGRKLKGFDRDDTVMKAVESRSSSPVRILRDKTMQSIRGIYPAGEGAGYAGGITSAAVDGIKAAEKIIEQFREW